MEKLKAEITRIYNVYKAEDDMYIHHEYIDCPECNEKIMLDDDDYFGY